MRVNDISLFDTEISLKAYPASKIRVLHVDDDPCFLDFSKSILELEGNFEVENATSVDEAVKKMGQQTYDAIISDFEMPQKNGLNFLADLRGKRSKIPFILFTGKGREEVAIDALNLGADGYYDKQGSPETVYGELAHGIRLSVARKQVEQELIKSEAKYCSLFANMLNGFAYCRMVYDEKGKPIDFVYLEVNDAFEKLTGLKKENVVGKEATKAIPGIEKSNPELFEIYGRVALTGKEERFEIYFKFLKSWLSVGVYSPEKGYFCAIFEDITDRKKAVEELKSLKNYNEDLINSIGDTVLVIDPSNYRILDANEATLKQLKLNKEDLVGKTCYEVTHNRSAPCATLNDVCPMQEMLKKRSPVVVEHQHFDGDNRRVDVEVSVHPVIDKDGKIVQVVHVDRDITRRKQQERENKAKSDEINAIVNGIGDMLFVIDKNRVIIKVNKSTCDAFKKKPEELIGKHCYEIVHGTDTPWCNCPATKTFETKQVATEEIDDPNVGVPLLVTTSPILDEQGEVAQVIHIAKDITKIKFAEMEMQVSASLFEAASDSILVHDLDGKFIYFNEAAHTIRGYSEEEFQELKVTDLEAPGNTWDFKSRMKMLLDKGEGIFETLNLCKDKTVVPFEIHAQVIEFDQRKLILSVARDISERKKAEEKLMLSERKYREFADSLPEIVFETDDKGTFIFLNRQASEIMGYSIDEMKQANFMQFLAPEDRQKAILNMQRRMRGDELSGNEYMLLKKDGSVFPAAIFSERIIDEDGKVGLRGVFVNISQIKKAEEKLELMNEKLRVVGGLTRHDVRNKLTAVTGYAYLIKKKHADQADIVDGLSKMEQAVKESVRIFDFAKMYEQIGVEDLAYIQVEDKLSEAVVLFSGSLPKIMNETQGLKVLADSFLRQMFYNLIDNTRKYGKKATAIRVHYEKTESGELHLIYEDDGVGISQENKLNLFKEGFSTGGSTGFGLFLIKKMMDVYGWAIQEIGEPCKGVKFVLTIPKVKNRKEAFQTTS